MVSYNHSVVGAQRQGPAGRNVQGREELDARSEHLPTERFPLLALAVFRAVYQLTEHLEEAIKILSFLVKKFYL